MIQKELELIEKDSKVITKVLSFSLVSLISSHSVFSFLVCTCRVPMHFSEILTPTLFVHRVLASDWKNRVVCDLWWFYSFSDGQIGAFSGWVLRVFIALEIQDKKVNHMHISISCDKWYIPQCWKSLKSLIWILNMLVIKFFFCTAFNFEAHCLKNTQNISFELFIFGIFHQFLSYQKWPVW